jgi:hypothetical protein
MQWSKRAVAHGILTFNGLNIIDAVFTLFWIGMDYAEEANPLMGKLIEIHPVLFFFVKVFVLGGIVSGILWKTRNEGTARVGIVLALVIYSLIVLYNIGFIGILMFNS